MALPIATKQAGNSQESFDRTFKHPAASRVFAIEGEPHRVQGHAPALPDVDRVVWLH